MRRILFICFLYTSISLQAQEVKRITLKEAVSIAIENNINIKQERNNLDLAGMQSFASKVDFLPTPDVNLSGGIGTNEGNSFNPNTAQVINGRLDQVSGTASISKTLFAGLNRYYTYKQNKNALDAQVYQLKWTKETVIGDVAAQYLQCLLDQELLDIAANNVKLQEEQLNKVKVQVELGSVAEVEKHNQEYQLKNAQLNHLRATTALRNSKTELLRFLQLGVTVELELVEPNWNEKVLPDDGKELNELISLSLENRADLKRANELERTFDFQLKAMRGLYYPSVTAFLDYGSRYNFIHNLPQEAPKNREFNQQFTEDNVQTTYGLSINIPILNGLATRTAVYRAKVNYENTVLANDALLNTVKTDVLNAFQNYNDAIANYNAAQSQLEAAKMSFSLEEERFNLGASDLIQYTQANQNLVKAEGDLAQAYYTLIFQDLLLNYATGTLTIEDIPE